MPLNLAAFTIFLLLSIFHLIGASNTELSTVEELLWKILTFRESIPLPLHAACRSNDTEAIKKLIASDCEIDVCDGFYKTPLMYALTHSSLNVIAALIEAGADVNRRCVTIGETPLMIAVKSNFYYGVKYLLDKGAVVDLIGGSKRETPLDIACVANHVEIAKLLIHRGAQVNYKSGNGNSPLHKVLHAISSIEKFMEYSEIINVLLDNGADLALDDENGYPALILAIQSSHIVPIKRFLRAGANINQQTITGETILSLASYNNQLETVTYLIEQNVLLHLYDRNKATPLHYACSSGAVGTVQLLLDWKFDINARTSYEMTPLNFLLSSMQIPTMPVAMPADITNDKWVNTVKVLLNNGANPALPDCHGNTPLMNSGMARRLDLAQLLIESRIDVDQKDAQGSTALGKAVLNNLEKFASYLLEHRAMVDLADNNEFTPLHYACQRGSFGSVKVLIENKANINLQTNFGDTPLNILFRSKYIQSRYPGIISHETPNVDDWTKIVDILIKNRAELNISNRDGDTPLISACRAGQGDMVGQLLTSSNLKLAQKNIFGFDAIIEAALLDHDEIVEFLLERIKFIDSPVKIINQSSKRYLVDLKCIISFLGMLIKNKGELIRKVLEADNGRLFLVAALLNNQVDTAKYLVANGVFNKKPSRVSQGPRNVTSTLTLLEAPEAKELWISIWPYYLQPKRFAHLSSNNREFFYRNFCLSTTFDKRRHAMLAKFNSDWIMFSAKRLSENASLTNYEFAQELYAAFRLFDETLVSIQRNLQLSDMKFIMYLFDRTRHYLNHQYISNLWHYSPNYTSSDNPNIITMLNIMFYDHQYGKAANFSKYGEIVGLLDQVLIFFREQDGGNLDQRLRYFNRLICHYPFAVEPYLLAQGNMNMIWMAQRGLGFQKAENDIRMMAN